MVKAKIPAAAPVPAKRPRRDKALISRSDSPLFFVRMKELDREFARQTKQLTALTKKFGRKLTGQSPD